MKLVLAIVAMGCAMTCLVLLAVLDLVVRNLPLVGVAVAVWAGARWWLRRRRNRDDDTAADPMFALPRPHGWAGQWAPGPRPGHGSVVTPVVPAESGDVCLVSGDEHGLRPPPNWPAPQQALGHVSFGSTADWVRR
ncbi:hypothetical protein [Mycolicibacterium mageritense]|uniref:hypothetical protein n=1 Tax=Mycolicibacterium mageritense TaxID=53462 RepID=UPI001E541649|nr:hypothetical protein [Mycolicibacterium mageritense]